MMKKRLFGILLAAFLLSAAFSFADDVPSSRWYCLYCASENTGPSCTLCGRIRGVWTCVSCGTENLSDTCRSCGASRESSLKAMAADSNLLAAWPAVRVLADEGYAEGIMALGRYYALGLMLPQDTVMALSCWQMAGTMGYAPAWVALAKLYDEGELVSRDDRKAMEYYQKAADLDDPEAVWSLGTFYEEGFAVRQDYQKALSYYRQAADMGYADSWMSIAYCYDRGLGVEPDEALALEYYEKAASLSGRRPCPGGSGQGVGILRKSSGTRQQPQYVRPRICL